MEGLQPENPIANIDDGSGIAHDPREKSLSCKQNSWSSLDPGCLRRRGYSFGPRSARNPVATTYFSRESARLAGGFMLMTLPNFRLSTT